MTVRLNKNKVNLREYFSQVEQILFTMKEYVCLVTVTVYICEYSSHSYMSAMVNKCIFKSVMVNKCIHSVNINLYLIS